MTVVRSYSDYASAFALALPLPGGPHLFLFIEGCVERFVSLFGQRCRADIGAEGYAVIEEALQHINKATAERRLIPAPTAYHLQCAVDALPVEDFAYLSSQLIEAVAAALRYCIHPSGIHARVAAEAVINALDADAIDKYAHYRLEDMFVFPELSAEWERQAHSLKHLCQTAGGA